MNKITATYNHNISEVVAAGLCVSCGTCASVCNNHSISFQKFNIRNDWKPCISETCSSCGKCLVVCPGRENYATQNTYPEYLIGPYMDTFIGFTKNRQLRYRATSGGLLSSVSLFLLRNQIVDYVITVRMSECNPFLPEPFFASEEFHVQQAMGSKYCPVPLNLMLNKMVPGKRYAYIGLPCHIQGLKKYLSLNPIYNSSLIYCFGLFCSRTPSFKATEFILRYNHLARNQVRTMSYRSDGHPGSFCVVLKNGETIRIPHLAFSNWGHAFLKYFIQYRCWFCDDKTARLSDVSFGDDWTISIKDDPLGRSNLIVRSQAAMDLLNSMHRLGDIELLPLRPDTLITVQELERKCNVGPRFKAADILRLPRPGRSIGPQRWHYRAIFNAFGMLFRIKLSSLPYPLLKLFMKLLYKLRRDE